ncbi:hypothetical protein DFJ74DRAFT_710421 [Hyaloraphidium curvatum]|nr:hypothetical protein DFJ74DRAFT_710421 [Hyaloraphidium curvatum]
MGGGHGHGIKTPLLDPQYPSYNVHHPSWIPRPPRWQVAVGKGLGAFCFSWMMIFIYREFDHMRGIHPWDRHPEHYEHLYPYKLKKH